MKHIIWLYIFNIIILYSKPPIEQLPGLFNIFRDYQLPLYLSPVCGVIYSETMELKNRAIVGNEQHAMIKIIKLLFHRAAGDEFEATQHEPYKNFTATFIAHLLFWLEKTQEKNLLLKQNLDSLNKSMCRYLKEKSRQQIRKELIPLLERALEEQKNYHEPYYLYYIILAFLYHNYSIEQIWDYVEEIAYLHDKKVDRNDYQKIKLFDNQDLLEADNLQDNAEHIIHKIVHLLRDDDLPPHISFINKPLAYENFSEVYDCCESTLREIITIMYALSNNSQRNCMHQKIKSFFTTYDAYKSTYDEPARYAWMQLISQLPDIKYRKQSCEIHPSLGNFLSIMRQLLIPHSEKIVDCEKKFPEIYHDLIKFCHDISIGLQGKLECIKATRENDINTDVQFKLSISGENKLAEHYLTLHIMPEHAYVTRDNVLISYKKIMKSADLQQRYQLPLLLSEKLKKINDTVTKRLLQKLVAPWTEIAREDDIYCYPTCSDAHKYQLIKRILFHNKNVDQSDAINKMLYTMQDTHLVTKSLQHIIPLDIYKKSNVIATHLPRLDDHEQKQILDLRNKYYLLNNNQLSC